MFAIAAPDSRPVNVALEIEVGVVRTKSSAASISNLPGLSGRVAIAIFPSGLPVVKNGVAATGPVRKRNARDAAGKDSARVMSIPPLSDFFTNHPPRGGLAKTEAAIVPFVTTS